MPACRRRTGRRAGSNAYRLQTECKHLQALRGGDCGQAGGDSERTPIHYGADEAGIVGGSETADRTKRNGMGAAEVALLIALNTHNTLNYILHIIPKQCS